MHKPAPLPGFVYFDSPEEIAESKSWRPIWLTTLTLSLLLSSVAVLMVRKGFSSLSVALALFNPLTFLLGWLVFLLTPWRSHVPAPYQIPFYPLMFVLVWLSVAVTAAVFGRFRKHTKAI